MIDVDNLLDYFQLRRRANADRYMLRDTTVVDDVYQGLAFVEYLEKNVASMAFLLFDRIYIRSLQVFLILSSSDALGDKSLGVGERFFDFWNHRSDYLKTKLVLCYYPANYDSTQVLYERIVKDRFYKTYRNPFAHDSAANFPPLRFENELVKTQNELKGISFMRKDGRVVPIDVPLTKYEAEYVFQHAQEFFLVIEGQPNKSVHVGSAQELVTYNDRYNSFKYGGMDLDPFVHNGLLKLLKMAIVEECEKLEGRNTDWENNSPYVGRWFGSMNRSRT